MQNLVIENMATESPERISFIFESGGSVAASRLTAQTIGTSKTVLSNVQSADQTLSGMVIPT